MKLKIKIDEYAYIKPSFMKYMLDKKNIIDEINQFSASSFVPVICLYYFWGDELGFDEELLKAIDMIVKFYNYDVIRG